MEMEIGVYRVTTLLDGPLRLDGGAMFGVVPRVAWKKKAPPDRANRISLVMRCMLLENMENGCRILVDTGMGASSNERESSMFGRDGSFPLLPERLAARGIGVHQIDEVVLTHLHFDHSGGATSLDHQGRSVPTFPNARVHVQQAQLHRARHANERDRASFREPDFEPLAAAGRLVVHDGEAEPWPGIRLLPTTGHTPGHQMVFVTGRERGVVFPGDSLPTRHHLRLPWVMGYDLQPAVTVEEKRELLSRAAADKLWIVFDHDPDLEAIQIEHTEDRYSITQSIPAPAAP